MILVVIRNKSQSSEVEFVLKPLCRQISFNLILMWRAFCLFFQVKYRLTVILTILLTSVTFKLSTAGKLPMISYNTLLDIYILANMLILVGITLEISILSFWKHSKYARQLDVWSVVAIGTFLVLYHIVYWVRRWYCTSYNTIMLKVVGRKLELVFLFSSRFVGKWPRS